LSGADFILIDAATILATASQIFIFTAFFPKTTSPFLENALNPFCLRQVVRQEINYLIQYLNGGDVNKSEGVLYMFIISCCQPSELFKTGE